MYTYSFEKLDVWNLSKKLAVNLYSVSKNFPDSEKYGMVNQIRRAIISVCSNIAEGSSRRSAKDQAHFYTIAYSSLIEVLSQLIISRDLNWITVEVLTDVRNDIEIISRRLNVLRNTITKTES